MKIAIANIFIVNRNLFIWSLLFSFLLKVFGWPPVELGSFRSTAAPNLPIVGERYIIAENFESVLSAKRKKMSAPLLLKRSNITDQESKSRWPAKHSSAWCH